MRSAPNLIAGEERAAVGGDTFAKLSPATGRPLSEVARSDGRDVAAAVAAAADAQPEWAARTVADRGAILRRLAILLERDADELAGIVASETGKAPGEARGEVGAAIEQGHFVAGEGRRFYGRTTTSAVPGRQAMTIRQPLGVAGLIIAANTPIANVAWKAFPALLCGNGAVLKAPEDTPETPLACARLALEAGVPPGILNVVQGYGEEAGRPLVEHEGVAVVSFTGSTAVGREIARVAGERLAKVCLELGGKNPFVVCDDADLEGAARAAALSAFSNAGQRCAAGSRIIVFDSVYERFRELLLGEARAQKVGPGDEHDYGPVINERQLERMLAAVARARDAGATVLCGGERLSGPEHHGGFYIGPTLVEEIDGGRRDEPHGAVRPDRNPPSGSRLRRRPRRSRTTRPTVSPPRSGPRASTAAQAFVSRVQSGVASVNGPTYGSEPHMPFGGERASGNGWREAGTEALDVYSDWKTVYLNHDPARV